MLTQTHTILGSSATYNALPQIIDSLRTARSGWFAAIPYGQIYFDNNSAPTIVALLTNGINSVEKAIQAELDEGRTFDNAEQFLLTQRAATRRLKDKLRASTMGASGALAWKEAAAKGVAFATMPTFRETVADIYFQLISICEGLRAEWELTPPWYISAGLAILNSVSLDLAEEALELKDLAIRSMNNTTTAIKNVPAAATDAAAAAAAAAAATAAAAAAPVVAAATSTATTAKWAMRIIASVAVGGFILFAVRRRRDQQVKSNR